MQQEGKENKARPTEGLQLVEKEIIGTATVTCTMLEKQVPMLVQFTSTVVNYPPEIRPAPRKAHREGKLRS